MRSVLVSKTSVELRQHFLDDLLAVDDLDQEALAIDVAIRVEGHIHQDAGLAGGLDGEAMQIVGERLRIDLAHFFGGGPVVALIM